MKKQIYNFLMCVILICPMSLLADNYVIINQVMYDSPLNENMNKPHACNGEFVELYNAGTSDVSLADWKLKGNGVNEEFVFATGTVLPAGKYVIIACRRGADNTFQLEDWYNPMPDNTNYSILYQNRITLSNDGETLTLCNAQNDTVDRMEYDGESHLSKPYRLEAANADSIPGNLCVSLHRTWVEFDAEGKVILGTSQWQKEYVTFGEAMLPYSTYQEDYLFGEQSLSVGENYVLSVTPLDPTMRIDINDGRVSVSSGIRVRTELQYMDGLGRSSEVIALGITPGKNDLVSITDYQGKSLVARQWLPVVMNTEGQRMDITAAHTQAQNDYGDDYPYTEAVYENSALKRQIKQIRPGNSYRSNGAEQIYDLNSAADQVRLFTVVSDSALHSDGTYYQKATLYKNTINDEDDVTLITFTDQQGRKIMERRDNNSTYYVYDDMGRLRFVLPGLLDSKLSNGTYQLSNPYLKAAAYCYKYDDNGNVIYKRLPGCEAQYMVYDQMGQLVLKQDGNQRSAGKWTMCAYDSIGRNLYMAEMALEQTHAELVSFFADKWQVEHYGHNHSFPLAGTGYASQLLKNQNIRLLTINYYDNYDYLDILPTPVRQKLRFSEESGYVPKGENTTGLLTGTRVYNLSEDGYISIAYYYDHHGRVIQNRSVEDSIRYSSIGTEYLFDGSIAQQKTERHMEDGVVTEHYHYTYDHAGRAKSVRYQLNNDAEIILSAFSYDSIGRLVQNLLYQNQGTTTFSYDMRNRLKTANNKHFFEELFYADHPSEGVTPCFNGNISAIRMAWTDTANTYIYAYDAQNRLLSSKRLTDYAEHNSELFGYDEMGNITSLKRFSGNHMIDDLDLDYGNDGHQLLKVTDRGHNADLYSTIEYHNAAAQTDTTMFYDANGNLVRDLDRGVSAIRYNILNLPDTIIFSNGNRIVNLYDAAGRKYKSIVYTVPATAVTTSYELEHEAFGIDSVEYRITEYNGNIETCFTPQDTTLRIFNTIGYWADSTYFYTVKDHLGNICAVVNANADTVVQRTMYYASGVPMALSWGRDTQPYLYNGKEFVEAHGWNTYDYGFRGYYAPIGRFTTIDPLAEQTPWLSPYSYAGNRFVNAIDWMGLSGFMSGYNLTCVNSSGEVVFHENSSNTGVYLVDDDWKEGDPLFFSMLIGREIPGIWYCKGGYSDFWLLNGDYFSGSLKSVVAVDGRGFTWQYGFYKEATDNTSSQVDKDGYFKNVFNVFTGEITALNFIECNPLMWGGANGNVYNFSQLTGKGSYVFRNSYKQAVIRGAKGPLGKLGTGLSAVSVISAGLDIYRNGWTTSNAIDLGMAGAGVLGGTAATGLLGATALSIAPWIITGVSIYGVIDIGVTLGTGTSLSGWIGEWTE